MAPTPRLALSQPSGTDLISQGDNLISADNVTLDDAAIYKTGTLAARGPAATLAGKFYYATDDGSLSFSTGTVWLVLDAGPGVPIGGSLDYVGSGDPADTRFLLEDGRAISRSTYATLHGIMAAAGYPYGNGNGTTTFNIPDSRGRHSVAPDDMGTAQGAAGRMASNNTLGQAGGAETRALATGNLPAHSHGSGTLTNDTEGDHFHGVGTISVLAESSHTHGVGTLSAASGGTHNHTFTGNAMSGHSHGYASADGGLGTGGTNGFILGFNYSTHYSSAMDLASAGTPTGTISTGGAHTHSLTGTSAAGSSHVHALGGMSAAAGSHTHAISGATASVGSGTAFNQMGPYLVKNKIIRVL
jgi:microcystin-dependent protein